ncbi:Leucine Rich repeat-containing protein [Planctomicrobium piriforme]|uniref:Leucine Rich repeat-containing protein n=2 Tax=Planctomicrobium piriforme TaxID=1576369 RepID=A0A1I3BDJ7_9PLAN|nr:Leucine Rich repeat-containing protein [Planctomicrobium piriforme]
MLPVLLVCAWTLFSVVSWKWQNDFVQSIERRNGSVHFYVEDFSPGIVAQVGQGLRKLTFGMWSPPERTYCTLMDLKGSGFDDIWMQRFGSKLRQQTHLRLSLKDCDITDDGLAQLGQMPRLEWLEITGGKITGRGLAALSLRSLQFLAIPGNRQFASGFPVNRVFPALESASVLSSKESPDFQWLSRQPMLRNVGFFGKNLSEDSISQLNQCTQLTGISVSDANDQTIKTLANLALPVVLIIDANDLTEESIPFFALMNPKVKVELMRNKLSDDVFEKLQAAGIAFVKLP